MVSDHTGGVSIRVSWCLSICLVIPSLVKTCPDDAGLQGQGAYDGNLEIASISWWGRIPLRSMMRVMGVGRISILGVSPSSRHLGHLFFVACHLSMACL